MMEKRLAMFCFVICILLWIPNLVFEISSPLWLFTYLFGPAGIVLAVLAKKPLWIVLNAFMSVSFFIFMGINYYIIAY